MYLGHILLPATQPAKVQEAAPGAHGLLAALFPLLAWVPFLHITGSGSSVGPSARNVTLGAISFLRGVKSTKLCMVKGTFSFQEL